MVTPLSSFSDAAPKAKEQARPVIRQSQSAAPLRTVRVETARAVVGLSSGKRTLAEVMDHDLAAKRQKRKDRDNLLQVYVRGPGRCDSSS